MVTEQNRILFCYHFLLNSSAVNIACGRELLSFTGSAPCIW